VRVFRLGEEPVQDALDSSTLDERIASVWSLTCAAWAISGREIPDYPRRETPGRLVDRGG